MNSREIEVDEIVVSDRVKINNDISKVFISYVIPLCIILPQMSGWIKYFENGRKNMSFKIEDDEE